MNSCESIKQPVTPVADIELLRFPEKSAVKISALRKSYGVAASQTDALLGIDLEVRRGEILGVLGPNGAGKTTLIEILEGLRSASAGSAEVLGVDVNDGPAMKALRSKVGIAMQQSVLPPTLTVLELLSFIGTLYPSSRPAAELIEQLGLQEKRHTRFSNLSGGQQQRVAVALALIGNPELIFLDEPTSQLDPQARRTVWDLLIDQRQKTGAAILVTTHQMEEAQRLCDRVLILDHGKILAIGTPRELVEAYCPNKSIEFVTGDHSSIDYLDEEVSVKQVRSGHINVQIRPKDLNGTLSHIMQLQQKNTLSFSELRVESQTLEDVFLKLTGRRIRA